MSFFPLPVLSRGRFPESVTPTQRCSRPGSMQNKKSAGSDSVESEIRKQDLERNRCSGSLRKEYGSDGVKTVGLLMWYFQVQRLYISGGYVGYMVLMACAMWLWCMCTQRAA